MARRGEYRDGPLRSQIVQERRDGKRDNKGKVKGKQPVFTARRSSEITAMRVGWRVEVPNGKGMHRRTVQRGRVGHKFGEWVATKGWSSKKGKKGK